MSRFFAGGNSDSESSSEEEFGLEEEEEEEGSSEESTEEEDDDDDSDSDSDSDEDGVGAARFLKSGASNFLKGGESDSDDEEERQKIRSAKDKRFDELDATVKQLQNALKINDWAQVSEHFDKAGRLLPNLTKALGGRNPQLYIKTLVDLDDAVKNTMESQKGASAKKMNAVNQRGLNAVRQKVKKLVREDAYVADVERYRKDPDAFMEEDVGPAETTTSTSSKSKSVKLDLSSSQAVDDEGGFEVVSGKRSFTPESVLKHLRVIADNRGKKSYDRAESLKTMERLLEASNTAYLKIRVLLQLVASRLDTSSGNTLSIESWTQASKEYSQLVELLLQHPNLAVVEEAEEIEDDRKVADTESVLILGSPISLAERLSDTLMAILVSLDAHGSEFLDTLKEEPKSSGALLRATILVAHNNQARPELSTSQDAMNRLLLKRLEHIYFRSEALVKQHEEMIWADIPEQYNSEVTPRNTATDPTAVINRLCDYLYRNSDGIIRARTMLCQCYWLARHDKYHQARDNLLMSHLSETIGSFDVSTQILYNRALVQIGMAAFRLGNIYEAQTTLQEICGSNRQKELLAQGVQMQRYSAVSPEQERLEKQRLLPFHMHINLELLEAIFLTSSMLLEIPLLAQLGSSPEARRKVISKTFRRLLEYNERSVFTGPPENTRDHVLQAAKALAAGEWKTSSELISKISVWKLLPDPAATTPMLEARIKIEGVRTYLFTYAPYYDTLNLDKLVEMFDLSKKEIQAIVSKMIASEELAAALDQVNDAVIFRKGVEVSRLQALALTLSDKASSLIESNEKVLEQRTQGTANAFERSGPMRGGRGGGRGRGGRGGFPGNRPRGQGFTGGALGRAIQA